LYNVATFAYHNSTPRRSTRTNINFFSLLIAL
jgi:hypothetical protein